MLTTRPAIARTTSCGLERLERGRAEPRPEPALPSDVTAGLGERLRACYAQLMNAPIPAEFGRLLEAMDRKERHDDGH